MDTDKQHEPLRACPICRGRIEPFQGPNDHTMGTCGDCGFSFAIPATAWAVAILVSACPICGGHMEVVYQRYGQTVVVCKDCHSGLTIPASSSGVIRRKREGTWTPLEP